MHSAGSVMRRAWRATIGRVARRRGVPWAPGGCGSKSAGAATSSYLSCVERLRSCAQSFEEDVRRGRRASLRVARAVRGAAEDCFAASHRATVVRGGEVQVSCAIADMRKISVMLVVEIERRGVLAGGEASYSHRRWTWPAPAAMPASPCPGRGTLYAPPRSGWTG